MNLTLTVDEQVLERARREAERLGKTLDQMVREYLQTLAGVDEPERSIDEFEQLSGKGDSRGWRFDRDEMHSRQGAGHSEDMQRSP